MSANPFRGRRGGRGGRALRREEGKRSTSGLGWGLVFSRTAILPPGEATPIPTRPRPKE